MSNFEKYENDEQVYKREQRSVYVRIMLMVNIVFILLLVTLGVIALKVNNVLPEDQDIFFIVGKNPSFEISDGEGKKWESETNINIFKSDYTNGDGVTTIVSQDGDKVIAPGFTSSYKFALYNDGNVAVRYDTNLKFDIRLGGKVNEEIKFPLKVKLYTDSGKYLVGSESEWVYITDVETISYPSQLGASSYEGFTMEVKWDFEGGTDEMDTYLGNLSAYDNGTGKSAASINLGIDTYAEEHIDPAAQGGVVITENGKTEVEQGGTIRWLWFILLFMNAGMLIFYIAWLLNKRVNKW